MKKKRVNSLPILMAVINVQTPNHKKKHQNSKAFTLYARISLF